MCIRLQCKTQIANSPRDTHVRKREIREPGARTASGRALVDAMRRRSAFPCPADCQHLLLPSCSFLTSQNCVRPPRSQTAIAQHPGTYSASDDLQSADDRPCRVRCRSQPAASQVRHNIMASRTTAGRSRNPPRSPRSHRSSDRNLPQWAQGR